MIGLEAIRENIQTALNANQYGKVFRLYTNDGEFTKAFRDGNEITEYINGICRLSNSSLTPLKALSILTMNVEVEFCIRVDNLEKDVNGNYLEVLNVQALCENFVNSQNGQTISVKDGDNTYVLAVNTEMPIVGVERLITSIGRCLPITLRIFYTMVENGVNSGDISLYIGNEEVPYINMTIDRVFVNSVAQKATEEVGRTTNEQNSVNIGFVAPLTNTPLGKDYTDITLDGGNNVAFPVVVNYKSLNKVKGYTMAFSSLKHTSEGVQNVGVQGSLVEVDTSTVNYKELNVGKWKTADININLEYADMYFKIYALDKGVIYFINWGDGKVDFGTSTGLVPGVIHEYKQSGDYNVSIFTTETPIFTLYNELILPENNEDFTINVTVSNSGYYRNGYVEWDTQFEVPDVTITVNFNESGTYKIDSLTANGKPITNGQPFKMSIGTKIELIYSKSTFSRTAFPNSKPQTVEYALGKELVDNTALLSLRLKDTVEIQPIRQFNNLTNEYQKVTVTSAVGGSQTLNINISNTTLQILDDSSLSPNIEEYYIETNYWSQIVAPSGE